MKKNIPYLLLFIGFYLTNESNAQVIPNANFENWSNGVPTGWGGVFDTIGISKSTDSQSGNYSVKIFPSIWGGQNFPGILFSNNGQFLATHSKSKYLIGYIKTNITNLDTITMSVIYWNTLDTVYYGGFDYSSYNRSSWTPFHVSLLYPVGYVPDSFIVSITIRNSHSSYILIDNFSLSDTAIGNEFGTQLFNGINSLIGIGV